MVSARGAPKARHASRLARRASGKRAWSAEGATRVVISQESERAVSARGAPKARHASRLVRRASGKRAWSAEGATRVAISQESER